MICNKCAILFISLQQPQKLKKDWTSLNSDSLLGSCPSCFICSNSENYLPKDGGGIRPGALGSNFGLGGGL